MRLIDADALEKELKKDIMGGLNYSWYINNAPTVCDIEQIRAEIEQIADNYNPMRDAFDGGYVMAIKDVLQIIDKFDPNI